MNAHRAWVIPALTIGLAQTTFGSFAAFAAPKVSAVTWAAANRVHTASASIHLAREHAPSRSEVIVVSPGDTLSGLARRYGTTVAALQRRNGLGSSTLIYVGETLRVLASKSSERTRTRHKPRRKPRTKIRNKTSSTKTGKTKPTTKPRIRSRIKIKTDGAANTAIAFARAQLGKPYVWGGTGPFGYDCSGLVQRAWQAARVNLPRTTYDQINVGQRISRRRLAPGDLIFTNDDGHVQMYIGRDRVIEAPHTGSDVRIAPLPPAYLVDAYVHIHA